MARDIGRDLFWRRLALVTRVALSHGAGLALERVRGRPVRLSEAARRLRLALEELGLTYLKLGQFLATRHDIVPPVLVRELTSLFEQVPAMPAEAVSAIVHREFGGPPERVFAAFDPVPIAAASVAQVHRARLRDGRSVAVKVQRPGIQAIFEADIAILRGIAALCDAMGLLGALSAGEIVGQFAAYTRREFDFTIEASTAERLRRETEPGCAVPEIVPELTTRHVLTMQLMDGVSLSRICMLIESGNDAAVLALLPRFDRRKVLQTLTRSSLRQFFVTGFFHGDPHPGNILVRPDNSIVLLDFGIFGELSPASQDLLASYAEHLAMGNVAESFRYLSQIYFPGERSDRRAFRRDAIATLRRWYQASRDPAAPMSARHLGSSFDAMVAVVRRHHYWTTMDYLLFWRAMIVLDSIALRIDDKFDLVHEIRCFFQTIRPDPVQRAVEIFRDPAWLASVRRLAATGGPAGAGSVLEAADRHPRSRGNRRKRLAITEGEGAGRLRQRRTRILLGGLAGVCPILAAPLLLPLAGFPGGGGVAALLVLVPLTVALAAVARSGT